ncbi:hypothetical protein BaRGS_00008269 [Batillaria attramentaria]|uniref:Uncharacterized protein n=1 Tax=Batillaria attramentaria TaxID=370345 RepID=A0ABD0LLY0_9CAEN
MCMQVVSKKNRLSCFIPNPAVPSRRSPQYHGLVPPCCPASSPLQRILKDPPELDPLKLPATRRLGFSICTPEEQYRENSDAVIFMKHCHSPVCPGTV